MESGHQDARSAEESKEPLQAKDEKGMQAWRSIVLPTKYIQYVSSIPGQSDRLVSEDCWTTTEFEAIVHCSTSEWAEREGKRIEWKGRGELKGGKLGQSSVLPTEYIQYVSFPARSWWMPEGCGRCWLVMSSLYFLLGLPWNKGSTKLKFLTTTTKFAKPTQAN
jgi:hypothetical protein